MLYSHRFAQRGTQLHFRGENTFFSMPVGTYGAKWQQLVLNNNPHLLQISSFVLTTGSLLAQQY